MLLKRRGWGTRLAIVEAAQALQIQKQSQLIGDVGCRRPRNACVTGHKVAVYLRLHPTTFDGHLKQVWRSGALTSTTSSWVVLRSYNA
jgi:hypothetical protein